MPTIPPHLIATFLLASIAGLAGVAPPCVRAAVPGRMDRAPESFTELWQRSITLGTLHQQPSQSEQDFLHEAAALVDALTATLAAEVCGVFERSDDGTRLLITLMTQGSIAYCMSRRADEPTDAKQGLAGQSLHSHVGLRGRRGDAGCLPPDVSLPELPFRSPAERVARLLGDRFSERDIEAGPGFLVHRGRLWHQQGWGTQRFIARVDGDDSAACA